MCILRLLLVVALYSHWSQANLISPCLDWLCILRVCLYDVFMFRLFVSIECALLDYFFCCFVLILIAIKYDPLMFRYFVHSQITFGCCFVLTLITIEFNPWFAWGNCQWFNSSCHISPYKILNLKFLKGQHALVSFRLHISSHCWYYSICYKYIEYHLAKPSILSS